MHHVGYVKNGVCLCCVCYTVGVYVCQCQVEVKKMMTTSQVVKVNREKLAACMTCPLCNKLFRDATTVSECLHTFCKKCIYEKIIEDESDSCPVCHIELGCAPLDKLRPDHNLQDLRAKIFPSDKHKSKEPETVPSIPLPPRRKEISLSSLVVTTPKVSAKSGLTGKRSKLAARRIPAPQESTFPIDEGVKEAEDHLDRLSSPETLKRIAKNKRQNFSTAESSKQQMPNKGADDSAEPHGENADLWKPLNCLVEAASKTKSSLENSSQMVLPDAHENEGIVLKANTEACGYKSKVEGDENKPTPGTSSTVKPGRSQGVRQRRMDAPEGQSVQAKAVVDANTKCDGKFNPIWFTLVAANNQEGDAPLPQISSCYLRVKDGSLTVSYIKKYVARKLDLASEAEVEIKLLGEPLLSTWQLHNLVDWWTRAVPASEKIQTRVGSSAKDFVMVLSYGRKARFP